ncbi:MAG TPA: universal stress protein [Steroidobacteraceae bacterium]|jgi:universal stress protein A|nr:universal stress protein [Steroidobacteraceae bacterium]
MTAYRRILAAIDLTQDSLAVAGRACEIARTANGAVQLLHVVEIVPLEPMSDSLGPVMQLDEQMTSRAKKQMEKLVRELGLPPDAGHVESGSVKGEILRYARELNSELIVLGGRERHGLSILLHRTEDSVLHGAPCDVLAVRVR